MYAIFMNDLHFEWDKRKSVENERKHNVSFEEAQTVFYEEKNYWEIIK